MSLVTLPRQHLVDISGVPVVGGEMYVYDAGTSTPREAYTTAALSVLHTQPVESNSRGFFPAIYVDAADGPYKLLVKDDSGVTVWSEDNIPATDLTRSLIGRILYPLTSAEQSANITPTNFYFPELHVERYGADRTGADDSTGAFNDAFEVGQTIGNAQVITHGGIFRIDGTLTPDPNKVGFDGGGCFLDCTNRTTADLWVPTQSSTDSLKRPGLNKSHPFENFVAQGPGRLVSARFMYLNDDGASEVVAGITVRNGASWDWETHLETGIGAYFTSFENWDFTATTGGGGSNYFVKIASASQSGERNTFRECRFGVCQTTAILQTNGNATTFLSQCSFNNSNGNFITTQGGSLESVLGHYESQLDTAYWFGVEGENTRLTIEGAIVIAGNKTAYAVAYCNPSVTAGGLEMDVDFFCSFTYSLPLVDGAGKANIRVRGTYQSGGQPRYLSAFMNRLHDGGFETGALTADGWTTSGGTDPTAASTNPRTGTYSLKVPGVNGQTNAAKVTTPCLPGQIVTGECYVAATGVSGGLSLVVGITYANAAGNTVLGSTIATITATQSYTRYSLGTYACAPAGTAKVELSITASGVTSGTPFGYMDDIILNVS